MRLFQHVYGRVSKGYQSPLPGYQLAAVSPGIAERRDLLQALGRLSFFPAGGGGDLRHSFYRPAEGYLAFGCSRLATDRSRSTGAFTHNFVCAEADFLAGSVSPVSLLQSLSFLVSEAGLPADRSLPEIDFAPPAAAPPSGRWRELALQIVDFHLGDQGGFVPMVVATEDETWDLLAEVFSLLPRLEVSRLSFSTRFLEASEHVSAFRLVFVPERRHVPVGVYVFRVFDLQPPPDPPPARMPLTELWRRRPADAQWFLELADALRREPPARERAVELLPELLALGRPFRDTLESLRVPGIERLLLADAAWLVAYSKAGSPLTYERFQEALWEDPSRRLPLLLDAAQRLARQDLAEDVLAGLAARIAAAPDGEGIPLLSNLGGPVRERFYTVAAHRMSGADLARLASALAPQPFYDRELHRAATRRVLDALRSGVRREPALETWLRQTAGQEPGFLGATARLAGWVEGRCRAELRLEAYELTSAEYGVLLATAWAVGRDSLPIPRLLEAVFDTRYTVELCTAVAQQLAGAELDVQKNLLDAVVRICRPQDSEHEPLLAAIQKSKDRHTLASHYRKLLEKHASNQLAAIERLRGMENKPRGGWLFGR